MLKNNVSTHKLYNTTISRFKFPTSSVLHFHLLLATSFAPTPNARKMAVMNPIMRVHNALDWNSPRSVVEGSCPKDERVVVTTSILIWSKSLTPKRRSYVLQTKSLLWNYYTSDHGLSYLRDSSGGDADDVRIPMWVSNWRNQRKSGEKRTSVTSSLLDFHYWRFLAASRSSATWTFIFRKLIW